MPVVSIVKKLSIIRSAKRVRDLILSYVDEVSKFQAEGRDTTTYADIAGLPHDRRYRFFGFLGGELDEYRKTSGKSRTELEHCAAWWITKTARLARKAHHIAFALPPEFARDLEYSGICPGDVLYDCICRTFETYREQFFREDELGFIVGLHREKAHPHAHVLFYPHTRSGRMVNFSRLAPVRVNGEMQRIDFQGYVQDRFAANVGHWRQVLQKVEQEREGLLWPAHVLIASDAVRSAQETATPEGVAAKAVENADARLECADPETEIAILADAAKARVETEQKRALGSIDSVQSVARNLQKSAPALAREIDVAQPQDLRALQLRAMRMAGRALDLSAAIQKEIPAYLRVVNTPPTAAAAHRLRAAQDDLNRYLQSDAERQRTVPLATLVNRDLNPHQGDEAEPVLTETSPRRARTSAIRSITLTFGENGVAIDFSASGAALAAVSDVGPSPAMAR